MPPSPAPSKDAGDAQPAGQPNSCRMGWSSCRNGANRESSVASSEQRNPGGGFEETVVVVVGHGPTPPPGSGQSTWVVVVVVDDVGVGVDVDVDDVGHGMMIPPGPMQSRWNVVVVVEGNEVDVWAHTEGVPRETSTSMSAIRTARIRHLRRRSNERIRPRSDGTAAQLRSQ